MRRKSTSRFMKKTVSLLLAATMTIGNIGPQFTSVYAFDTEGVENFETFDENGGYEDFQSGEYIVPNEQEAPVQDTAEETPAQNEAPEPIQEATPETQAFPVLESGTFDLGKSSVYIYDDQNAQPFVEYGGVTYKNPGITSFVLTGSSDSNKAEIMSDREYSVMLKDLSLSCDTPLAFYGNGTTHVKVSGSVKLPSGGTSLFTYENLKIDFTFEDNASIQCGGNIGATGDGAQITVNNGHITGSEFFTGSPVIIKGGNIQASVTNPVSAAGTSLAPVRIENLSPGTVYTPGITINNEPYGYGSLTTSKDGSATLYLPTGEISAVFDGVEYRASNNGDSPVLVPYIPEEAPVEEPDTESTPASEVPLTEAVTQDNISQETVQTERLTESLQTENIPNENETVQTEPLTEKQTEAISLPDAEPEAALENKTEAETAAATKLETEAETAAETEEAETEAETAAETEEAETEAETAAETEAETEAETAAETEAETEAETTAETEAETAAETETEAETEKGIFEYSDGEIEVSTDSVTASAEEETYIGDMNISLNAVKEGTESAAVTTTNLIISFPEGTILPSLSIEDNKVVSEDGTTCLEAAETSDKKVEIYDVDTKDNDITLSLSTYKNEEAEENFEAQKEESPAGETVSVASIILHTDSIKVSVKDPEYKVEKEEIDSYISDVNETLPDGSAPEDPSKSEMEDLYGISNYDIDQEGNYVFSKEEDIPGKTDYEKTVEVDMDEDASVNILASSTLMSDNNENLVVNHLMARVPVNLLGASAPGTSEYMVTSIGTDVGTIILDWYTPVIGYSGWTGPYYRKTSDGIVTAMLVNRTTDPATISFRGAANYKGQNYDIILTMAKASASVPAFGTGLWIDQMGLPVIPAPATKEMAGIKAAVNDTFYNNASLSKAEFTTANSDGEYVWSIQVLGAPADARWHMFFVDMDKDETWGISTENYPALFTTRQNLLVGSASAAGRTYSTLTGTISSDATTDNEQNVGHIIASGNTIYGYFGTKKHSYGGNILSQYNNLYFNWTNNAAQIAQTHGISLPSPNTIGTQFPISTGGQFTVPGSVATVSGITTSGWYTDAGGTNVLQTPYPPGGVVSGDVTVYADAEIDYGSVTPQKTVDMKGWNIAELPAANRTFGFTVTQNNSQTNLQNATTNKTSSIVKTANGTQNATTVTDVYTGSATVSETSYNSNIWVLNTSAQNVSVTKGGNAYANFTNTYKTGNLTVTKQITDPSGANTHKAGFVFRLTGTSTGGSKVNVTATTNNSGVATFTNIPVGTAYTVKEELTTAQKGYFEDSTGQVNNIAVTYNTTRNVNYTNIYKTGHIKVNKVVDMNGSMDVMDIEQISPNGFGTSLTGGTALDSAVTYKTLNGIIGQNTAYINNARTAGTSGVTMYTDIPVTASGRILKETDTNLPGNHLLDAWTVEIGGVVKGDDGHGDTEGTALSVTYKNTPGYKPTEITIKNTLKVGTVKVQKLINDWTEVNYTDKRTQNGENNDEAQWMRNKDLSGFKFVITGTPLADLSYNPSYGSGYRRYITGEELTNADGLAVFNNVPYGTYTLTEELTDAQKRIWHNTTKSVTFTINDSHKNIVIDGKTDDSNSDGEKDEYRNTLKVGHVTMNKDVELAPADKYNKAAELTQTPHENDTYKRYNESREGFVYHLYGYADCGIYEDVYAVTDASGNVKFENILKATKINEDGSANADHCYSIIEVTGQDVKDAADAGNYSAQKILRSWYVDQMDGEASITSNKKPLQSVRQYVAPVEKTGITVDFDDATADANAGRGQKTTTLEADHNTLLKWHGRFKKSDVESHAGAQQIASLAGATYGLYHGDPDNGDTTKLIATFVTDENGYFDIPGPYVLGDNWYLQEIPAADGGRASEGYLIDSTKYYIDCTIDDLGNNKNLGSANSTEINEAHITNADVHGRNAGTRTADGTAIIKTFNDTPQTDTLYESVIKNAVAIYKTTALATDGEYGQSEIGTDPLAGAGFTVYEISAIEKRYGINLSNRDDAFIAQYIKDQASNTLTTGNYTKLINDGLMPAIVYSNGAEGAKEHYKEYYGSAPDVDVNEVLDPKYCPYSYNGAGENTPLVRQYTYHDSDGNQIGQTFVADPTGTDENRYLAAEFFSNENGMAYSPMLPYGDYVIVETTVPHGKRAADPIVIHIRTDHNDGTTEGDNDGDFLGLLSSINDTDQASYVRILKKDASSNRKILKEGAQFLLYDDEERFVNWLAEKTSPSGKEAFIAAYKADESHYKDGKLLVVDPESGMGTADNPYEYSEFASQNDEWKIQTPVMLPMGTYTLEELHAPEGYILRGSEGTYRKNDDSTFWEAEKWDDAKWESFTKEVTAQEEGIWDPDTSLWDKDADNNPVITKTFTVDSSNRHFDSALGEYYYQVEWKDDPAVGKISVYAEGEVLKGASNTGTTVAERVGADFNGHPDAVKKIGTTEYDAATFKNMEFEWEKEPLQGVRYTVYADEDILASDGSETVLFAKDAVVTRLVTDENGEAHTATLRSGDGRTLKGLPVGKYYIVQENVPTSSHIISRENARREFEITYAGETVPILYKDEAYEIPRKKIEIAIDKYDVVTKRHMDGAIFALVTKDDIKNIYGEILAQAGEVIALSETYEGGKATFSSESGFLPLSNYYVCEFAAPLGYATSETKINLGDASMYTDTETETYAFKNTGYDDDYKIVDSPVRVYIRLSDYYTDVELGQNKNGTPDGGVFIVRDPEGNEITTVTTQANGENLLGELTPGSSYYIEQVKAPTGYVNETLVDNNRDLPYTEKYFDGVPYSVYKLSLTDMGANKVWFTVSDSQAQMQIVNVQNKPILGTIRIKKTGNVPDLDAQAGSGIENNVAKILKERLPQFTTVTNGADSRDITGIPIEFESDVLKDAQYAVYAMEDIEYPDGQTGIIFHENERLTVNGNDVFTTSADGTVLVPGYARDEIYLGGGLLPGTYRIEEVKAPEGYALETGTDKIEKTVTITSAEEYAADFENDVQLMSMDLTKSAYADGELFSTAKTNGEETTGVEGAVYALVALNNITNTKGKNLISAGVKVDEKTTDADGKITWRTDLPIGNYAAFEIQAPDGYYLNTDVIYYRGESYKSDSATKTIHISESTRNDISIVKLLLMDFDNEKELAGAKFLLKDKNGNPVSADLIVNGEKTTTTEGINTLVTGKTGHNIYGLTPGETYTLTEVKARTGYTTNIFTKDDIGNGLEMGETYQFTVPTDQPVTTIRLYNKRIVGRINLVKIGETLREITGSTFTYEDSYLEGVKFRLSALTDIIHPDGLTGKIYNAGDEIEVKTTTRRGQLTFDNLYLGTYLVEEITFPEGYVINVSDDYVLSIGTFVLEDTGENLPVIEVTKPVRNIRQKVRLNVEKKDAETGEYVGGGTYRLYAGSDKVSDTGAVILHEGEQVGEDIVLDESGKGTFEMDLPLGVYYMEEVKAPDGYSLPTEERIYLNATAAEDGRDVVEMTATFENYRIKVAFDALDFNDESKRLVGTKITVSGGDLEEPIETTIEEAGQNPVFTGFNPGVTYTITVTEPVDGYTDRVFRKDRGIFHTPYADDPDGYTDGSNRYKPVTTADVFSSSENTALFQVENVGGVQVATIFGKKQTRTVINVLDHKTKTNLKSTIVTIYNSEKGKYVGPDGSLHDERQFITIDDMDLGSCVIYDLTPGTKYILTEEKPREGYKWENIVEPDYESEIVKNGGYPSGSKKIPAQDTPSQKEYAINQSTFIPEEYDGIQVVTIFNEPVMTDITVTKKGGLPIIEYDTTDPKYVTGITWSEPVGLDGAEYTLTAQEDIVYPDGRGEVIHPAGEEIAKLRTKESTSGGQVLHGTDMVQGLYLGKYMLRETKAPKGYSIDYSNSALNTIKELDLLNDFYNDRLYSQEKYNEDLHIGKDGDLSATYTNERQGVDIGTSPEIPVTNDGGDPKKAIAAQSGIHKIGVDTNGEEIPVDGAVFQLSAAERIYNANGDVVFEKGDIIDTKETVDGVARFTDQLPVGHYQVREIDAPSGYYSSDAVIDINTADEGYDENSEVQMIRFTGEIKNPITQVNVHLKDDLTKHDLSGATFKVVYGDGPNEGQMVENPDGSEMTFTTVPGKDTYVLKGLDPDQKYILIETTPRNNYTNIIRDENGEPIDPDSIEYDENGYVVNGSNEYPFTISDIAVSGDPADTPEAVEIYLYNRFITGDFFVNKDGEVLKYSEINIDDPEFDYSDEALAGAEFTIKAAGYIYHPDGWTEPEGRSKQSYDDRQAHLFAPDETVMMNVRIINNHDGSYGIAAVTTTGDNGIAQFIDLYPGSYYITETNTPEGYATLWGDTDGNTEGDNDTNNNRYNFRIAKIDEKHQKVSAVKDYTNLRQKVRISVTKHDAENYDKTVAGATYVLKADGDIRTDAGHLILRDGSVIERATTGADGVATFTKDLPLRNYVIYEEEAPKGYVLVPDKPIYVNAEYNNNGDEVLIFDENFENEQTKTLINVIDADTNVELDDAVIVLRDEEGNLIRVLPDGSVTEADGEEDAKITTKHNANVLIRGLEPGKTYTVEEILPRHGYSNNIYSARDYENDHGHKYVSTYQESGVYVGEDEVEHRPAFDLKTDKTSKNTITFTVKNEGGVQVVTILNKPVLVRFNVHKRGPVATTVEPHATLESIVWEDGDLAGAKYVLRTKERIAHPDGYSGNIYEAGEVVAGEDILTTDETGTAFAENLLYLGKYEIEETKAPEGYVRIPSETKHEIDLTAEYDALSDDFTDYVFDIENMYYNERQLVDTGNFDGFHPDPEIPSSGDPDGEYEGKAGIYKVGLGKASSQEKVYVKGAEYKMYASGDIIGANGKILIHDGKLVGEATTDESGRAVFDTHLLPIGRYVIKETKAPAGYHSTQKEVIFEADRYKNDDSVQIVRLMDEFENNITKTVIYLKDDMTHVELAGADLTIRNADGSVAKDIDGNDLVFENIEDSHGKGLVVYGLETGKDYYIEETKPRDGYTYIIRDENGTVLDPNDIQYDANGNAISGGNKYPFTIPDDPAEEPADTVINLYNAFVTANLYVSKTGEVLVGYSEDDKFEYAADTFLEGVEFTLTAAEDIYHPDGKTGPDGTPDESADGTRQPLFKKGDDIVLMNVRGSYSIKLANGSQTTEPTPAVTVTDANGIATFLGLYLGSYTIKETGVPEGYVDEHIEKTATATRENYAKQVVECVEGLIGYDNLRQKVNITVTKIDEETKEPVGGAVFRLKNLDPIKNDIGDVIVEADHELSISEPTDADTGKTTFDIDLPLGIYYIEEVTPPYGYVSSPAGKKVFIDARYQGEGRKELNFDAEFENEQTKTVIEILDREPYDGEYANLGDTQIILKDGDNEIPVELVDGKHIAKGLQPGTTYTIVETVPQYGYIANPIQEKFLTPDGKEKDAKGYESVYGKNGYNGHTATDIPADSYDGNTMTFTTQDIGGYQIVTVFNRRVEATLNVEKKGEVPVTTREHEKLTELSYTITGLPNAEYTLIAEETITHPDKSGRILFEEGENVVETLTGKKTLVTDIHGKAKISGLYIGKYTLTEVKAPFGYSKFSEDATRTKYDETLQTYIRTIDFTAEYDKSYYADNAAYDADMEITEDYVNERIIVDIGNDFDPDPANPEGDPNAHLYKATGVYKIGEDNGERKGVAGAEFALYAASNIKDALGNVVLYKDEFIESVITDEDGRAAFKKYDLPVGDYYVIETAPPKGYFPSNKRVDFKVVEFLMEHEEDERDHIQIVRMADEIVNPVTTTIVYLKDVVTDYELEGARFQVLEEDGVTKAVDVNGNPIEWSSIDTKGEGHVIKGLDPNKNYIIEEILPREGYTYILRDEDGKEIHNVTGDEGKIVNRYRFKINSVDVNEELSNTPEPTVINLYNQYVTANVIVSKDGEVLTGHENMTVSDLIQSLFDYTSVDMPSVEFTIYALEDVIHPDGHTGLITRGGESIRIKADKDGTFIARKNVLEMDANGVFGDEAISVTEIDGNARWNDMFLGHYLIRETSTPEGYATNFKDIEFTAAYDASEPGLQHVDKLFEGEDGYHNERQKVKITVTKHDADDPQQTVAGAKFGLYATEDIRNARGVRIIVVPQGGSVLLEEAVTGEDGVAVFETDLPLGHYVIREIEAPRGYILSEEEIEVDATYQDDETHVLEEQTGHDYDFYNEQTKTIINVMDIDTQVELDDVHLRLTDENGEVVEGYEDITTVHEGNILIRGLECGKKYIVEEVTPRYGYSNETFIGIHADNDYESEYAKSGYHRDGIDIEKATDLKLRREGRSKAAFTITKASGLQVVSIFNERVKANIEVTKEGPVPTATLSKRVVKRNAQGKTIENKVTAVNYDTIKGLPGAEYDIIAAEDIYHPDGWTGPNGLKENDSASQEPLFKEGAVIAHVTTDANGKASFGAIYRGSGEGIEEQLYVGNYMVRETKAPRGYVRIRNTDYTDKAANIDDQYRSEFEAVTNGVYGNSTYDTEGYDNPRQLVDLGQDYDEIEPEENEGGDPLYKNYLLAGIHKIGLDGKEKSGVANAKFSLYAEEDIYDVTGALVIPKDTRIETSWSGDDGRAVFTDFELPVGKYYVVEDDAPKGYYAASTVAHFDATQYEDNDEVQVIRLNETIENPVVTVKVFLKDTVTKVELDDALLRIEDEDGKFVTSFITKDTEGEGYIIKGQMAPGRTYTITEVYPKDNNYTYIIRDENGKILNKQNVNQYSFTIDDIDPENPTVPEDVVINLYNEFVTGYVHIKKNGEVLKDYNADDDSQFTYESQNLKGITFVLVAAEDIYHPDGVTGPNGTKDKTENGKQIPLFEEGEVVLKNVTKTPAIAMAETNNKGIATFEGLYPGKYEFREVDVAEGYTKKNDAAKDRTFSIVPVDFKTQIVQAREGLIEYTNERQRVNIQITKLDKDTQEPLSGAEFTLYAATDVYNGNGILILESGDAIEKAVTGPDGTAAFEANLPATTYTLKETKAPAGYVLDQSEITVNAKWNSDGRDTINVKKTIYNEKAKVNVAKISSDKEQNIAGASLAIIDKTDKTVETWTTGNTPKRIEGLVTGETYTLKETKPAPGYATAPDVTFTVNSRDKDGTYTPQTVEMKDDPIRIQIRINEILKDGSLERLGTVQYHVEDEFGNIVNVDDSPLSFVTTDSDDTRIVHIPIGQYKIVIDSVPEGYIKPAPTPISVKDTSKTQYFHVDIPSTKIEIIAVDKYTRAVLTKVKIDLMSEDGNEYQTNLPLTLRKEKVQPGSYVIHVTQGPSGYVAPEDVTIAVLPISELQKYIVELDHTTIDVYAQDKETGQMVNGVTVDIINKNDVPLAHDVPLEYIQEYVPSGKYKIVPTKVPSGYTWPDDKDIQVRQVSEIQRFKIELGVVRASFRPVDAQTNKVVKGVKLVLRGPSGDVYAAWTSTNGWQVFKPINPGEYLFEATKVPKGYNMPEAEKVKIENISDMQYFELKLTKGAARPSTGGASAAAAAASASISTGGTPSRGGGKPASSPKTGDPFSYIWIYLVLASGALALMLALILRKRRMTKR